ncbi:MAG TPA: nucleotidyltransferase [Actinomycetota bacterium]|nr:nucleotidyltransferase [Actinomycetota bacterium]
MASTGHPARTASKKPPEPGPYDPGPHGASEEPFATILGEVTSALDEAGIDAVVFGGVAAVTYGRPRGTKDIDVLVRPAEAERTLEVLDAHGFQTEHTDERWLYKAYKSDVMVDVIFRVKGEIYLDDEMVERSTLVQINGHSARLLSREDALVIEAVSHDDEHPDHWYNALAIIGRGELDWDYVRRRARLGPRRLLALLVYAQSNDLMVPDEEVKSLFDSVYR